MNLAKMILAELFNLYVNNFEYYESKEKFFRDLRDLIDQEYPR